MKQLWLFVFCRRERASAGIDSTRKNRRSVSNFGEDEGKVRGGKEEKMEEEKEKEDDVAAHGTALAF